MNKAKQSPEMTPIEVGPKLIEAMVRAGYLSPRRRSDHLAIIRATQTMVRDLASGALPAPGNKTATKTVKFSRHHPPTPSQIDRALANLLAGILATPRH
jgi:hypothetical protein